MKHIKQVSIRKAQVFQTNCDINNPPSITIGLQGGNALSCLGMLLQDLAQGEKNKATAEG